MITKLKINKKAQCVGCRQCELACSIFHEGEFSPWLSRVVVQRNEIIKLSKPHICHQCKNAKCRSSCPNNAINPDKNGILAVNSELCDGCGICVEACPFHAMGRNNIKQKAYKCDLCNGEIKCVKACPANVLVAEEV
ncbi:4Fe-4S dicluster domain-containing protein [Sedimentibacter sp.]|uniref:4Fe-4S dicluster domain-containing protein n=1 Tax=Sedimentibacter sp. TaxID=1960295 RepID=UPI00289C9D4A|nr:4Fe-4S dicluster domain-containing protein [Sedimentibacter sp.]